MKDSPVLTTMDQLLNNVGTTENGARTHIASGSKLVDFFDAMGGKRHAPLEILPYFDAAWDEDPLNAMKLVFHLRNPRGGLGERRVFDVLVKHLLESSCPHKRMAISANIHLMAKYGRWDDLLIVHEFGRRAPSVNEDTPSVIASRMLLNQLSADLKQAADPEFKVSLVAKWLPSENASSKGTRKLAHRLMKEWGWNTKKYRQALKVCRRALGDAVVETKMSARQFEDIEFSNVCSKAGLNYREAFHKRSKVKYEKWLEDVKEGKVKVNASVLHPHEIAFQAALVDHSPAQRMALDNAWNALPDYDLAGDAAVVVDVSASMTFEPVSGRTYPIHVATALGLYLSERNRGLFHKHVITFDDEPQLVKLAEGDVVDKIKQLEDIPWGGSTNLQGTFDLILESAKKSKASNEDMPKYIYIITDGEFNQMVDRHTETNYEAVKAKFADAGYDMPVLVFWNVQKRNASVAMKSNDYGMLVSGFSPAILEAVMRAEEINPYDCMLAAIEPYYDVDLTLDTV